MNHDFDEDETGRSPERRSRRNPKMRDSASRQEERTEGTETSRSEREIWENRTREQHADENQKPDSDLDVLGDSSVHPIPKQTRPQTQSASRQTAASAEVRTGELPPHIEDKLSRRKKRRRIITMIVAECFALLFIFTYAFFAKKWNMFQRPDFKQENVKNNNLDLDAVEKMKGYWTIAIFGVDARDKAIAKGTNADVNLICNINLDTGEIKLVSVFRDTYLNISDKGSYNKINQAYFLGGPEQAVHALNQNLDLSMVSYMTFNWKAVADAINILGGVDIELSKAEFYYINSFITETVKVTGVGSKQLTHAGMNHLDGVQAVAYGRLRLMDTDYARTERQRKVIAQAFEKAKKADLATLNSIIGTVFPQVATNIGVDDLVKNASVINKFHIGETTGFPQARGDANMGKKGAVVVPQTLESNVIQLHEFLFGDEAYSPSSKVKSISEKIASDTGMYKAGKFVDHVSTGGGVIQPPKTTAAKEDTKEKNSKDEYVYETDSDGDFVYETDENGKKVKKKVKKETSETDEDGNPVEKTTVSEKPKTEPETDENGNPVESSKPTKPGSVMESHTAVRPGDETESSAEVKPGSPEETTHAASPGDHTETAAPVRPGDTPETTAAAKPGDAPGNSAPGNGDIAVPGFPGGSSEAVGSNGPGGSDSGQNSNAPTAGTVSAPGQ